MFDYKNPIHSSNWLSSSLVSHNLYPCSLGSYGLNDIHCVLLLPQYWNLFCFLKAVIGLLHFSSPSQKKFRCLRKACLFEFEHKKSLLIWIRVNLHCSLPLVLCFKTSTIKTYHYYYHCLCGKLFLASLTEFHKRHITYVWKQRAVKA